MIVPDRIRVQTTRKKKIAKKQRNVLSRGMHAGKGGVEKRSKDEK
jgi:hypothetical protein